MDANFGKTILAKQIVNLGGTKMANSVAEQVNAVGGQNRVFLEKGEKMKETTI